MSCVMGPTMNLQLRRLTYLFKPQQPSNERVSSLLREGLGRVNSLEFLGHPPGDLLMESFKPTSFTCEEVEVCFVPKRPMWNYASIDFNTVFAS